MAYRATMVSKTDGTTWKSKKTILETGVKSDVAFCLGSSVQEECNNAIKTSKNEVLQMPSAAHVNLHKVDNEVFGMCY